MFKTLFEDTSILAPLRFPVFRRIWFASVLSNLGQLVQGVGAAWAMTQLTTAADMVALVQTATMLPLMIASVAAGAIADMYDRRLVAMYALIFALLGAAGLSAITWLGMLTPMMLLAFCFLIGTGVALFGPAWQASVSEQVPSSHVPSGIALNSISYNIARSFGPAVGGLIVAAAGTIAAFAANAILYIPLILVLFFWRRTLEPSRLPPEGLHRAIISGLRFVFHSPPIRIVLARTFITGTFGASLLALMPLVAKNLLNGNATTYGLMLGMFGIGAVIGALNVASVGRRFSAETQVCSCALILSFVIITIGISTSPWITGGALIAGGAAWMLTLAQFNIGVQLAAPRWVSGRSLASFQAAITAGMALGSWFWGHLAQIQDTKTSLIVSGIAMLLSPLFAFLFPMPTIKGEDADDAETLDDPDVKMAVTGRSGPIIIEVEYRVALDKAREFYGAMLAVQGIRKRTGAFGWSIARDIGDPELWTERFQTPTWHDYLRYRNRPTPAERTVQQHAASFSQEGTPIRIRRMLERPFGSVRWKPEVSDNKEVALSPLSGSTGGAT